MSLAWLLLADSHNIKWISLLISSKHLRCNLSETELWPAPANALWPLLMRSDLLLHQLMATLPFKFLSLKKKNYRKGHWGLLLLLPESSSLITPGPSSALQHHLFTPPPDHSHLKLWLPPSHNVSCFIFKPTLSLHTTIYSTYLF